jgi:hypothetical protein
MLARQAADYGRAKQPFLSHRDGICCEALADGHDSIHAVISVIGHSAIVDRRSGEREFIVAGAAVVLRPALAWLRLDRWFSPANVMRAL